jgi:hypothetical protein
MRSKRGFAPISQFIQFLFLILLGFLIVAILVIWAGAAASATKSAEQASLIYTITTSVNALSTTQKGLVEKELKGIYDIEIECNSKCYIKTTPYDNDKKGKSSEKILIVGDIELVSKKLSKIGKICIEKIPKKKVVIRVC